MPGIQPIKMLAHAKFASHGLKLPTSDSWQQPSGDPDEPQYGDAIKPEEKVAIPNVIPPYFTPQNAHKYHQDSCNDIGGKLKSFVEDMIDAVSFAHNMWKLQAKFKDLRVMAVSAIGSPGCLDGPELEPLIKQAPTAMKHMATANGPKWVNAVAAGVSKAFKNWQDQVMVPGLPWYPAFAAFPGPQAPPMPNVPTPLIACPSAKITDITMPNTMASEMGSALDSSIKDNDADKQYEAVFDAIATALAAAFLMWLPMQQVMLVMGKGPIPTFAPPYVPVGPVVAGDNIPTPGHLMS